MLPCDTEAAIRAAASVPACAARRPWVLVAAVLGSTMAFVDESVVNVALPKIESSLHTTLSAGHAVGRQRLHAVHVRAAAGRRCHGRPVRSPARVPDPVCWCSLRHQPRLRSLAQRTGADRRARAAGRRGGAARAVLAGADCRSVRREGARRGDRHLVRRLGDRRGRGPAPRRHTGGSLVVACDLSDQSGGRRPDDLDRAAPRAREPRSTGVQRARLARGRAGIQGPERAGLRADRRRRARLDRCAGDRSTRSRCGRPLRLRARRGPQAGADDAARAVPSAHLQRRRNLLTLLLYGALGGAFFFFCRLC